MVQHEEPTLVHHGEPTLVHHGEPRLARNPVPIWETEDDLQSRPNMGNYGWPVNLSLARWAKVGRALLAQLKWGANERPAGIIYTHP